MRRRRSLLIWLVLYASMGACASNQNALHVAASMASSDADVVPLEVNGHQGVWMEDHAFEDILVGIVREKGDLKVELAKQKVMTGLAEQRAQTLENIAKQSAWRAVWLPVISFGVGVLATGAAIIGGIYAGQALHSAP